MTPVLMGSGKSPRKLQSMGYDGPIEISKYQQFQWVREQLHKDGINLPLPTGN